MKSVDHSLDEENRKIIMERAVRYGILWGFSSEQAMCKRFNPRVVSELDTVDPYRCNYGFVHKNFVIKNQVL